MSENLKLYGSIRSTGRGSTFAATVALHDNAAFSRTKGAFGAWNRVITEMADSVPVARCSDVRLNHQANAVNLACGVLPDARAVKNKLADGTLIGLAIFVEQDRVIRAALVDHPEAQVVKHSTMGADELRKMISSGALDIQQLAREYHQAMTELAVTSASGAGYDNLCAAGLAKRAGYLARLLQMAGCAH